MTSPIDDMMRVRHRFSIASLHEDRGDDKMTPQPHIPKETPPPKSPPPPEEDTENIIILTHVDSSVPIVQQMAGTESEAFILAYLSQFQQVVTGGYQSEAIEGASIFSPTIEDDFINPLDIDKQDVSDDDPTHIESALIRQAEEKYKDLLYKKELQLLRERKLQAEAEEYERGLAEQLEQSKISSAQKKKAKERLIDFWLGVLFGDMGGELFGNMVVPFAPCPPAFVKIFTPDMTKVNPVEPIAPIKLLRGWSPHYIKQREPNIPTILRWINKIFAGLYRAWCEQNPSIKCEYHQRGPPCGI